MRLVSLTKSPASHTLEKRLKSELISAGDGQLAGGWPTDFHGSSYLVGGTGIHMGIDWCDWNGQKLRRHFGLMANRGWTDLDMSSARTTRMEPKCCPSAAHAVLTAAFAKTIC